MNRPNKVIIFAALLVAMLVSGVAATPASLAQPGQPTATATANAGELLVTWDASAGAQFYTVGWAEEEGIRQMLDAGREWRDAFHYAVIPAAYTSYTVSGLKLETPYYTIIGAQSSRFNATDLVWGPWSDLVETAEGSCPTIETTTQQCFSNGTCLPIREIGRVSGTGDSTEHVFDLQAGLYRFTLTGDYLVSADLVATTAGRNIFYFDFIGRDEQSAQELVTVEADDAGTFVLEIDAGGDSWQFDIVRIGG